MARGKPSKGKNRFRIIGGRWRGRRLAFPDSGGVRPSPDRVRETLFNWLGPELHGARALDLFAGSGALGLEALSRGVAGVRFLERDRQLAAAIRAHLEELDGAGEVIQAELPAWLQAARPAERATVDLVFLDPPYDAGLHRPVLEALIAGHWLAPGALIYLEYRASAPAPDLPDGWTWHRQAKAGDVAYGLLREAPENT